MPQPVIAAVGASPIGRTDLPGRDLFSIAVAEAFEGLPDPETVVEAIYVGNQSERYERQIMHGSLFAEWAGLGFVPAERVEGCAASGALALRHATKDVRNGDHDAVLAAGVEKMTAVDTDGATGALAAAFDRAIEGRSGVTAPSQYALLARRYLHETDATERDFAAIAVKNHRNALDNPRAQFSRTIDVETVLESAPIAPPLKLYDCAPIGDGAAAVLVTSAEIADRLGVPWVAIAGSGTVANNLAVAARNLTEIEGARVAAETAYLEAGIEPADVDIAEVHDAFTVCEALLAEAAGFAPTGAGYQSHLPPGERDEGWSDVRLSTSGGLKARGHPIGATGLLQAIEAYEQLTGLAGDRSVPDAKTALLINEGGVADAVTVAHVLTARGSIDDDRGGATGDGSDPSADRRPSWDERADTDEPRIQLADLDAESPFTLPGFFDALAGGELLGGVCEGCGQILLPPRPACYSCGSRSITIEPQPREGTIYTHTEVHTPPPAFEDDAPYTIAIVELRSGGRLTGRVERCGSEVAIGDPVLLETREPDERDRGYAPEYETEWPVHVFAPSRR